MDIVKQKRLKEGILITLVSAMALLGNLSPETLHKLGIERDFVLAVLGIMIVLALFMYVRLFFFVLYLLLALGANLPDKWASEFGIDPTILLITLVAMVLLSGLNYSMKLLPSGVVPKKPDPNPDATSMLVKAIDKGNMSYIGTILTMNFDLDVPAETGLTPLMHAARQGDLKLIYMLLKKGATISISGPEGKAADIALKHGHASIGQLLNSKEALDKDQANATKNSSVPEESPRLG